uniref:KIB1-4 beta-propeller domain-containing protein n=1 Tax=Aegilops tauschii TaxID=37682 RepID=M8C1J0_AEGTA
MGCITSRLSPPATAGLWTGQPPDLLLEVSARLRHATDVVCFHAVCSQPTTGATATLSSQPLGAGSSNASHGNLVASVDGMATWFFAARPEPRLIDIFTGDVARLPPLPDQTRKAIDNFRGVIYKDRTVFLYSFQIRFCLDRFTRYTAFTAAMMCPGDAIWTVVEKRLNLLPEPYAMYHDGKVLVWDDDSFLCFRKDGNIDNIFESGGNVDPDINISHEDNYFLESHGELLWASVMVKRDRSLHGYDKPSMRVMVRALQKEPGSGKRQWVAWEGRILCNLTLFLGSPASFATRLDIGEGCAYFVFRGGVFRYSFVANKAKPVKWVPFELRAVRVWLRPNLTFASTCEIQERLEAQKKAWKS